MLCAKVSCWKIDSAAVYLISHSHVRKHQILNNEHKNQTWPLLECIAAELACCSVWYIDCSTSITKKFTEPSFLSEPLCFISGLTSCSLITEWHFVEVMSWHPSVFIHLSTQFVPLLCLVLGGIRSKQNNNKPENTGEWCLLDYLIVECAVEEVFRYFWLN